MPLSKYILPKRLDVGLQIERSVQGMVPEIECREAAVYVGVTWHSWEKELTGRERAAAVAHYRIQLAIKAHTEDAVQKAQHKASYRKQRKS